MSHSELPSRHYLLRLWLVDGHDLIWRASLEDPSTAERHGFGSLDRLFAFLRAETDDLTAQAAWQEDGAASSGTIPDKEHAMRMT